MALSSHHSNDTPASRASVNNNNQTTSSRRSTTELHELQSSSNCPSQPADHNAPSYHKRSTSWRRNTFNEVSFRSMDLDQLLNTPPIVCGRKRFDNGNGNHTNDGNNNEECSLEQLKERKSAMQEVDEEMSMSNLHNDGSSKSSGVSAADDRQAFLSYMERL